MFKNFYKIKIIVVTGALLALVNLSNARSLPGKTHGDFSKIVPGVTKKELAKIKAGFSLYSKGWVTAPASTRVRDGLGPMFNAVTCTSCHQHNGRGRPPIEGLKADFSLLIRLSIPGKTHNGAPIPEPNYGGQFHPKAILGVKPEGSLAIKRKYIKGYFADGHSYELEVPQYDLVNLNYGSLHTDVMISPRVAPAIIGLGYLNAIDKSDILKNSDEFDKNNDGISGRPNWVYDIKNNRVELGRFGWKASQPNLAQQNAAAFNGDLGITSSLFEKENCTEDQDNCNNAPSGGELEIDDKRLSFVNLLTEMIDAPKRRNILNSNVINGEKVFKKISCNACHIPDWITATNNINPALSGMKISPYTDLLLHDMGEGLADNRPDFEANGREWKTPPLWGIGLQKRVNGHTRFLHDGRARNLEEAILWHGGEAKPSQEKYLSLSLKDRQDLLSFLNSL
jgi:CxxC motif-containing protein (DUF1111 family)